MTATPEQFQPDMKSIRVYYEVGGEETNTLWKDIEAVIQGEGMLKIIFGKDYDGDRQRFMHYNMDRVIGWKVTNCDGELAEE